eukprot:7388831-Prymnesium_polylepis.2
MRTWRNVHAPTGERHRRDHANRWISSRAGAGPRRGASADEPAIRPQPADARVFDGNLHARRGVDRCDRAGARTRLQVETILRVQGAAPPNGQQSSWLPAATRSICLHCSSRPSDGRCTPGLWWRCPKNSPPQTAARSATRARRLPPTARGFVRGSRST